MKMRSTIITFIVHAIISWSVIASAADEVPSGEYSLDPTHSYINFSYSHMGYSNPVIRFRTFSGELDYDASDISKSSVEITIDATSIDGGTDVFNGDLRAPNFFDTETYPEIDFASTSYEVTGENTGTLTGTLTVKDETQPLTLDVTLNRAAVNPMMKLPVLGFSATGTFSRTTFGLDNYVPVVGDTVTVTIESEFAYSE